MMESIDLWSWVAIGYTLCLGLAAFGVSRLHEVDEPD